MNHLFARLVPFICVALGVGHVDKATDLVNGWNGVAATLALDALLHIVRTQKPGGIFWAAKRVLTLGAVWIANGGLRKVSAILFSFARFAEALANYSDKVVPQRLKTQPQEESTDAAEDQKSA